MKTYILKNLKTNISLFVFCASFLSCTQNSTPEKPQKANIQADSMALIDMINERELAMKNKNIALAMAQFADDITWINSQGYYFEGKEEVFKFHQMLAGNDTLDYYYEAGQPKIRITDARNAIAYYSWKMFWFKKDEPVDTTIKEIGLMTLAAQKQLGNWKWIAVTNQHTPWFYQKIEPVIME